MKLKLDFTQISAAIRQLELPHFDLVVGIGRGGIVPASLLAYKLETDLVVLPINYRDDENSPRHEVPQMTGTFHIPAGVTTILVVDDVSVSGSTLQAASALLAGYDLTTLVLKGKADFVVFPDITSCVEWPWNPVGAHTNELVLHEVSNHSTIP